MSVTVDTKSLPAETMGMRTVGEVLNHLQKDNRLVVHVLVDGQEPDLTQLPMTRQIPLSGHTLYIETADPRELALNVLDDVQQHLQETDSFRTDAIELLQQNQPAKAMEKLKACFTTWQHAQESILKTAQLLRIDLDQIDVAGQTVPVLIQQFAAQLREIKSALENRDFVLLADILTYEATETTSQWSSAVQALRDTLDR